MSERSTDAELDADVGETEFDRLTGVVADGVVGAVGGLSGTAVMAVFLFVAARLDAFEPSTFAVLAGPVETGIWFLPDAAAVGYVLFLFNGMTIWPLLFASIGRYLPGERFATRGIPYGVVLWTGFVVLFYEGYAGGTLALYLALTLAGHIGYGFALGSVFDYLSGRPETLV